IRAKVAEGRTILFSTHLLDQAEKLCTQIAILARGRLVANGTLAELRARLATDSSLEEIFFSLAGAAGPVTEAWIPTGLQAEPGRSGSSDAWHCGVSSIAGRACTWCA